MSKSQHKSSISLPLAALLALTIWMELGLYQSRLMDDSLPHRSILLIPSSLCLEKILETVMTTFSDGAYPPVMGAITTHIRESNPPIPIVANNLRFFKFNNSALYSKPRQTTALAKGGKSFDETYWEVGYSSFHDFFHHLGNAQPCTLSLTRDVLDELERLQTIVQGIQQDIRKSMNSIDEMRQEKTKPRFKQTRILPIRQQRHTQ